MNSKIKMKKYFCLVLHSHIPFVRKAGVWPFGEEWLLEGMLETYLPLLQLMDRDIVKKKITIGITPVLLEQMNDDYFKVRFEEYAKDKIMRAESDIRRFSSQRQMQLASLAEFYKKIFQNRLNYFRKISGGVVNKFSSLQSEGAIEVIASAATHSYLPLLKKDSSIRAQLKTGIDAYKKYFDREPRGFWLPECGYRPPSKTSASGGEVTYRKGLDEFLAELGIKYFFVDAHAVDGGETTQYAGSVVKNKGRQTKSTSLLPYHLGSGLTVLGRSRSAGMLVWSNESGYPGDGNYREFHKKDSTSGLQYWKITSNNSDLGMKELYLPENVASRIEEHARHFSRTLHELMSDRVLNGEKSAGVVSPYDTELYGHWWFEGIEWLETALKKIALGGIEAVTASEYIENVPSKGKIKLPESSWGDGGGHYVWQNKNTNWMWNIIHRCENMMEKLVADQEKNKSPLKEKILKQVAREKLLLESSDWPFLVTTWQARSYAENRFLTHYDRFLTLGDLYRKDNLSKDDADIVEEISSIDALFKDIECSHFKK